MRINKLAQHNIYINITADVVAVATSVCACLVEVSVQILVLVVIHNLKMKLLVMTLTVIAVLVSASIDDHEPSNMPKDSIYYSELLRKTMLEFDENFAEFIPRYIQDLEEQMEELSDEEACLLSQYNELQRDLNIWKVGRKHDDDESVANQTLLLQQVQDRKELLSIVSSLSQVNTKILKLMEEKLKGQEMSMKLKVDIAKHRQKLIELQSKRNNLQSKYPFVCDDDKCCLFADE